MPKASANGSAFAMANRLGRPSAQPGKARDEHAEPTDTAGPGSTPACKRMRGPRNGRHAKVKASTTTPQCKWPYGVHGQVFSRLMADADRHVIRPISESRSNQTGRTPGPIPSVSTAPSEQANRCWGSIWRPASHAARVNRKVSLIRNTRKASQPHRRRGTRSRGRRTTVGGTAHGDKRHGPPTTSPTTGGPVGSGITAGK